jgi:CRP-like cAMP-binding protein
VAKKAKKRTDFLRTAGKDRTVAKYRKNQTVFRRGDSATSVFFIQQGRARIETVSTKGKPIVVAILGTGDFFGDDCLTGRGKRPVSATAMTDGTIARFSKAAFRRALRNDPKFSEMFMSHLLAGNARTESDLLNCLVASN